ncbi:MAG TPA: ECF transporter S component, partial [Candidatus Dorea intestinavium]|nr:ECF transporter S component [Candidatus Dorea intestinavium]
MSTDVLTNKRGSDKVKRMVQIGMLSAIAVVLMLFEIPLPFAPPFYKIDFSEIPVMIGGFAMGPMAAVVIEFVKIVLNLIINGTMTAGIGELANFLIGIALVLPAALIYKKKKTRKAAALGMGIGTLFMTLVGSVLNAFVLLPTYAKAFSMPLEGLVEMGTAIN